MNIGQESLNYMGPNAPLAKELDLLFQSVFVAKSKFKGSNRDVISQVRSFVNCTGFKKKFHGIVNKHTGLNMNYRFYVQGASYMFAIGFEPSRALSDENNTFENTRYQTDFPSNKELQDELEAARKTLNKDSGKIEDTSKTEVMVSDKCTLHFCVDTAFCLDLYHEKSLPLTSSEITGIVLHEIGHVLSVIDYSSTLYRTLHEYAAPIKVSANTIKDLKKSMQSGKKYLSECEKSTGSNSYIKNAYSVIYKLEELVDDTPNVNIFKSAICAFGLALLSLILFPITIITTLEMFIGLAAEDVFDTITFNKKNANKDSDFKHTRTEITDIEFRADEYVATFGYSHHMLNGLRKMTENAKLITPSHGKPAPYYTGQTMFPYNWNHVISLACAPFYAILEEHGFDKDRYQALQESILKRMRTDDMPDELMEGIISQYQQTKVMLESITITTRKNNSNYHAYGTIIKNIITGGGLLNHIINGKADKMYVELMRMSTKLTNNELIYQRKRLERA